MKLWMGPLSGRREPRNDLERRVAAADEQAGPVRHVEHASYSISFGAAVLSFALVGVTAAVALVRHLI